MYSLKIDISAPKPFEVGSTKYVKLFNLLLKHSDGHNIVKGEIRVTRPGEVALEVYVDNVCVGSIALIKDFDMLHLIEK